MEDCAIKKYKQLCIFPEFTWSDWESLQKYKKMLVHLEVNWEPVRYKERMLATRKWS